MSDVSDRFQPNKVFKVTFGTVNKDNGEADYNVRSLTVLAEDAVDAIERTRGIELDANFVQSVEFIAELDPDCPVIQPCYS